MHIATCTARDIHAINETKEYTLISTHLLNNVLEDQNLNAQASKLWQVLFNMARFNKNLEIQVSYAKLANMLGKSTRTISRYITTLIKNNYIVIKNNYSDDRAQISNTIFIRFPDNKIKEIKTLKDRTVLHSSKLIQKTKRIQSNISSSQNVQSETTFNVNQTIVPKTLKICITDDKIVSGGGDKTVKHNTKEENTNNNNLAVVTPNHVVVLKNYTKNTEHKNQTENRKSKSETKEITELKNFRQEEMKSFLLNTKNVSKSEEYEIQIKNEIDQKEKMLVDLELKLSLIQEKMKSNLGKEEMYKLMNQCGEIQANQYCLKNKIEYLNKQCLKFHKEKEKIDSLKMDINFMREQTGQRAIPTAVFNRLVTELGKLGFTPAQKILLTNEIVFETRFGSLQFTKQGNADLSINHAVNIAIKLVREKRWSTPAQLKNFDFNAGEKIQ